MSDCSLRTPYISKLEGSGFQPGQSVLIRGIVLGAGEDQSGRFDINLACGPRPESDEVPLHVSVRQDEKKFVFNTFQGGEWGKEERKSSPYKEGDNVDIRIRAHDNKFEVIVNQKELCTYDYRMPLTSITHLVINGCIDLTGVNWGGKYYAVPYQAGIDGGLRPGKKVYITGVPEKKAERFEINLHTKGDTALHFNPRFSEKAVVRNSQLGGAWGNEEREGKIPFEKDRVFDLVIANESYSFQVFVNGQQFCTFAHRTAPDNIDGLSIKGDIELQGLHVK